MKKKDIQQEEINVVEVQEDPVETERTNEYAERVGGNYEVEKDDSEAERYQKKDEGEKDEVEEARTREGHEDGKVKRETVGAQEGLGREEGEMEKKKKKEDSPGDLRYETLIKIISSASVGCQGAYTTASRECNDLNGNNSVKDAERSTGRTDGKKKRDRFNEKVPVKKQEKRNERENELIGPLADSSNTLHNGRGDSEVQPSAIAGEAPGRSEPYETVAD
ncbi:hypothetical protein ALC56_12459 [Trachymyrmex septentrionalis]|uniref:Uncharacterized protein n=1 Tax=Trachymyrmex septentrionalis TaxID=34720 RepID=A0A195EYE7_9HYME|nr:hypothetical protein ALC56_12459 [Trachymyrmex septentrionalis]